MRRTLLILMAALLMLTDAAFAQSAGPADAFVVCSVTQMSGNFFTDMWGNNTTDIDVRTLIHGYRTVAQASEIQYLFDPSVVSGYSAAVDGEGNKTYVIELQKDLTYNDGTPITASDYVFSILLSGSPVVAQLGGIISTPGAIVGYEAYASGQTDAFAGVRLIDTHRFSIAIKAEYLPYFYEMKLLDWAPCPAFVIAPGCTVSDDGSGAFIQGDFTRDLLLETVFDPDAGYMSHPKVTCGPYQLVEYDRTASEARFEINNRYKGDYAGQKPSIPVIVLREAKSGEMIGELESGAVQLINKVTDGQAIDEGLALAAQSRAGSIDYLRNGFGFISFACEQGPAQFQAVRQAVAHCVDAEAFTADFLHGYGQTVHGYMGLGQWMVRRLNGMTAYTPDDRDWGAWEELSIDSLIPRSLDLEKARTLLIEDGWTLNAQGDAYAEGQDKVRFKRVDGDLMALSLNWAKLPGSAAAELLEQMLTENFAKVGIALTVTEVPFAEMLKCYYRQTARTYDMFYLATNFEEVFDPYLNFNTADEYQGARNTTGLRDEALMGLAKDLRETEPGDLLGYCQKWLKFQLRWGELMPMVPLYSNIYFDFFDPGLVGYEPSAHLNWASAILYANFER